MSKDEKGTLLPRPKKFEEDKDEEIDRKLKRALRKTGMVQSKRQSIREKSSSLEDKLQRGKKTESDNPGEGKPDKAEGTGPSSPTNQTKKKRKKEKPGQVMTKSRSKLKVLRTMSKQRRSRQRDSLAQCSAITNP